MHIKDLDRAIAMANHSGLFEKLSRVYDSLPSGQCQGCTACCRESVPTFFIEFVHIVDHLRKSPELFKVLWPKIEAFYFTELVDKKRCPFLDDDDGCSIYEVRPLPCRLFGFSSKLEYDDNLQAVKKANREVKKYYRNAFRLDLPGNVVEYEVPFCTDFIPERVIGEEERLDYCDMLFGLDTKFLMGGLLDPEAVNQTLIHWFIFLKYEKEMAGDMRIEITRQIVESENSPKLRKILNEKPLAL